MASLEEFSNSDKVRSKDQAFSSAKYRSDPMDDYNKEVDASPLPSVNERLAYLRPSREILEYYRKKIGEFDDEHDSLINKLDQYKLTYEEQHKSQWELRQRENEISELQKALSDMQVYLFQEREHVLRLYAENDRLKIRELEDRKKIQTLLSLNGVTENEVSYFIKEPPAKAIVQQKLPKKLQNVEVATGKSSRTASTAGTSQRSFQGGKEKKDEQVESEEKWRKDHQTLLLQIEALQTQLQEQTKLAKEQIDALMEDRRVKSEEFETRRLRDQDKLQTLTEKLHKTQDLLYDSTRDFLNLRYEHRDHETQWMQERDSLLQQLDTCHQKIASTKSHSAPEAVLSMRDDDLLSQQEEFRILEYKLTEAQKMSDMYREQVIDLEDQLARIREEGDVGKEMFKAKSEKMAKHLSIMNKRYNELEKRRNLEVEGFKTDIKNLRTKLKEVEKQLYKVMLSYTEDIRIPEQRPDDIDMQILRNVKRTASRSNHLLDELKTLKSKVYGLENDLRHL